MRALAVLLSLAPVAAAAEPAKKCTAPPLSDDQVKAIIGKARAARTDLPKAFPKSTWKVSRRGCYYIATEFMDPPTPDADHMFTLNPRGIIVDVTTGISATSPLACPAKVYDNVELATIVTKTRAARSDLPQPFKTQRVAILRSRCLYMYFEYRVPERRGDYQLFTIDPLGELMDAQVSTPY
jgi:hypothetical protein